MVSNPIERFEIQYQTHLMLLIVILLSVAFSGCGAPINEPVDETDNGMSNQTQLERTTTSTEAQNPTSPTVGNQTTTDRRTSTSTETQKSNNPTNWPRERKYSHFRDNYTDVIVDTEVVKSSIKPDNESMEILYRADEENGTRRGNQTREVIIAYAILVDLYLDENTSFDREWIPKHVNVTAVNSSEDIYYTGHVKFDWAYKWQVTSEWESSEYIFTFYDTIDHGPAHPDYEEDPFDK